MTRLQDSDANYLWQKENELKNHRLTWLGATQSFLFAGMVFSYEFGFDIVKQVAFFGAATSAAVLLGTVAATWAQLIVWRRYPHWGAGVNPFTTVLGWISVNGLPLLFVAGWLLLAMSLDHGRLSEDTAIRLNLGLGSVEIKVGK